MALPAIIPFYNTLDNKLKELQATVGIVCSEIVYREDSMQSAAKADRLFELYAGNKESEIVGRVTLKLRDGTGDLKLMWI